LRLDFENRGDSSVRVELSAVGPDFIVVDSNGIEQWRRRDPNAPIAGVLSVLTIARDSTVPIIVSWDQKSRAGRHIGVGRFAVFAELFVADQDIRLGPGYVDIVR
jgi:hypothetical protein